MHANILFIECDLCNTQKVCTNLPFPCHQQRQMPKVFKPYDSPGSRSDASKKWGPTTTIVRFELDDYWLGRMSFGNGGAAPTRWEPNHGDSTADFGTTAERRGDGDDRLGLGNRMRRWVESKRVGYYGGMRG